MLADSGRVYCKITYKDFIYLYIDNCLIRDNYRRKLKKYKISVTLGKDLKIGSIVDFKVRHKKVTEIINYYDGGCKY